MLIINELLRCSNEAGEKIRQEIELNTQFADSSTSGQSKYQQISAQLTKSLRPSVATATHPMRSIKTLSAMLQHHRNIGSSPLAPNAGRKLYVKESATCRQLVLSNYDEICEIIKLQLNTKNTPYINFVLLMLITRLAALNPAHFVEKKYFSDAMQYLLNCVRSSQIRANAFSSIGMYLGSFLSEFSVFQL